MPEHRFHFKEFSISQEHCAMKVGTDGVLLGAWIEIPHDTESVLDIGTGTGLIALQLAQRSDCPLIDALEIEDRAFEQAVENFENSPWSDRLFCYHASLEDFRHEIDDRYDLIVSNPPFFNSPGIPMDAKRKLARQSQEMSFGSLLDAVSDLLSEEGTCAFVIPYAQESEFTKMARQRELFPVRITRVRGHESSPLKRSLVQFKRTEQAPLVDELVLEKERHVYTEAYIALVRDFYLRM